MSTVLKNLTSFMPPLPDTIALDGQADPTTPEEAFNQTDAAFAGQLLPLNAPAARRIRMLRQGCYLLRYTPTGPFPWLHYYGTLRVERNWFNVTASGDLYLHRTFTWPPRPVTEPSPTRIPIFARSKYRYYLRITQILEAFTFGNSFTLGYELFRFEQSTSSWTNEGTFKALMSWTPAPAGYPSGTDYLTGDVKNSSGSVIGTINMAWVSRYLRRAVIEIDRVEQSEFPEESGFEDDNGEDIDWRNAFEKVGWNLSVVESDDNVAEVSGESWSDAELHQKMLQRRDASDLDSEWRYHLLCVRRLDSTSRGIMYDAYGGDSNNIPREGAGMASHWMIPDTPTWGDVRGMRFGEAEAPYFRTAVHELGHAMGLYHNSVDNGFMNTTGVVAASGTTANPFPDNVMWRFSPNDEKRLRHMPDPWVRPGAISFGQSYNTTPISPDDMVTDIDGLDLTVTSVLESVPIGAPVRVDVELTNRTSQPITVPKSLSLKSGNVCGRVMDSAGVTRDFWPLIRCIDDTDEKELAPNQMIHHSLTLLRGPQGALFPSPGTYEVAVDVNWEIHGYPVKVTGKTNLMVTPAVGEEHAAAALKILSTPDALLTLAIGGDHLEEGIAAIKAGLNNRVLGPHYAIIEAKRIGRRFGKRRPKILEACALLDDNVVLSSAEVRSALELIKAQSKETRGKAPLKKAIGTLKHKVEQTNAGVDEYIANLVKEL